MGVDHYDVARDFAERAAAWWCAGGGQPEIPLAPSLADLIRREFEKDAEAMAERASEAIIDNLHPGNIDCRGTFDRWDASHVRKLSAIIKREILGGRADPENGATHDE